MFEGDVISLLGIERKIRDHSRPNNASSICIERAPLINDPGLSHALGCTGVAKIVIEDTMVPRGVRDHSHLDNACSIRIEHAPFINDPGLFRALGCAGFKSAVFKDAVL